ncbi:MAG TPA: response regulator [Ktedonobacteraceae bacterium]|jgi:DNA-binding response OmpR family regulator|nr:response regulator [Ktedonobacteraceae bacterium]
MAGARILVVNDTQEILELFRLLLEDEGYEVMLSSFPIQKVTEIEQMHPDLIILDFVFGDQKSGWQMLQMLKMWNSTASIPIIVCTAATQLVREQEGYLVSKGVHVVYKPFDIDELLAAVKQALEIPGHIRHPDQG